MVRLDLTHGRSVCPRVFKPFYRPLLDGRSVSQMGNSEAFGPTEINSRVFCFFKERIFFIDLSLTSEVTKNCSQKDSMRAVLYEQRIHVF